MGKKSRAKEPIYCVSKNGVRFSRVEGKKTKKFLSGISNNAKSGDLTNPNSVFWGRFWNGFCKNTFCTNNSMDGYAMAACDWLMTFTLAQRRWHNVFIETENLVDFLESMTVRDADMPAVIENCIDYMSPYMRLGSDKEVGICVHLANREFSILCNAKETEGLWEKGGEAVVFYRREEQGADPDIGWLPLRRSDAKSCLAPQDTKSENVEKTERVILNLFLYMSAFPECVKEGAPSLSKGSVEGSALRVCESNAIKRVYERGPVTPHMRRGHFRVLRSERYTKKRNAVVYVAPTMVRGKADTITESQ